MSGGDASQSTGGYERHFGFCMTSRSQAEDREKTRYGLQEEIKKTVAGTLEVPLQTRSNKSNCCLS